ncbi:DUF401 family protein [Archaeoglobus sulfaticallidus]|uniref:DUF401 family protein n=1 Tax=Archaeoglobus sulfaticallidus TaxID=1316941 RepID=UPI000B0BF4FF|nr:DUF401 family protein [Archaeoglobus sulfaticallidus]
MLIRFINISVAILAGSFILGFLTLGLDVFSHIISSVLDSETLRIVTIVVLAFTLGYSMEYLKLFEGLTNSVSRMTGMFSVVLIPLIVGFLPMPGGALISAIMIASLVKEYRLSPERATFINYWFRHLWVAVWPLYPSFVVGVAVLKSSFAEVVMATYPIAILAILSGMAMTFSEKFSIRLRPTMKDFLMLIYSFYPVLLVAVLAIGLKIDFLLTLVIANMVLFIHKRVDWGAIRSIFRRTIDFNIIILIFAVMIYKNLIETTSSAEIFFQHLNEWSVPVPVASFIMSFLIGFSTGVEISYASVALPLLTGFTGVGEIIPENVMLVFGSGFLGVMTSPLHLCLVLTAQYFNARLYGVYRYLIPAVILEAALIWVIYVLL